MSGIRESAYINQALSLKQNLIVFSFVVTGGIFFGIAMLMQLADLGSQEEQAPFTLVFVLLCGLAMSILMFRGRREATVLQHSWRSSSHELVRVGDRWSVHKEHVLRGTDQKPTYYLPDHIENRAFRGVKIERSLTLVVQSGFPYPASQCWYKEFRITDPEFWESMREGQTVVVVTDIFGNVIRIEA